LGGPVRTSAAVAALDAGADDALLDGVLLDGVLDGVLLDGVLLDGVLLDGVLLDGVLDDGVLLDGVLDEEVGAVVGVVVVELEVVELEVVELDVDEVVVGGVTQPVTQKTLCLVSAPWEPSALTVSLTWNPCCGCGSMPVKSSVYVAEASSPASEPPPLLSSSPMATVSVRSVCTGPVGGCASNVTVASRSPSSKP
jgi:hypothetical protein